MTNVQPFRGLRYNPELVADWGAVLGPPYDIVDQRQTDELKGSSPHQIAHIETAAGDQIAEAASTLQRWRESDVVVQDEAPAFYLHEHCFSSQGAEQVRRAIFGVVELTPWGDGVMAHERTMPGPKATRTALRSVVGADVSPLMAFAPDSDGALAEIISTVAATPALCEGTDPTGDSHSLRLIDDPETVSQIVAAFAEQRVYMADGHHRYESALASIDDRPQSRFVLMGIACANDPALRVGATHRVAYRSLPDNAIDWLGERFTVTASERTELPASLRDGTPSVGLVSAEGAWRLDPTDAALQHMPNDAPEVWGNLSAAILQFAILDPLLGIDAEALAGGEAVGYTHHADELFAAIDDGSAGACFLLSAPTLQDVIATADSGSFMPQKSTYFVPKLPTGLVLHSLD